MASYTDYRDFIKHKLDMRTLLEQLAEEAIELSKASLKLIRAKGLSNNSTPIAEQEAIQNLLEEVGDVMMVLTLLCSENKIDTDIENNQKWKRWAERLGDVEE